MRTNKMKGQKKIIDEIEAIGLRVKVLDPGLAVYPSKEDDNLIFTPVLNKLIAIAYKYGLGHYINFAEGYVRLH